jgi:DNA repair protein RadC
VLYYAPAGRRAPRLGGGSIAADAIEYQVGLKSLPAAIRPRERLVHSGAGALSDTELLAIILRTGTRASNVLTLANQLLARHGSLGGLDRASVTELCAVKGLGEAKAVQVKAALEMGRRLTSLSPGARPQVRSPHDVANLFLDQMSVLPQEHLRVVLLNTKNQITSSQDVYKGSLNASAVRVGEVFREAIRDNSAALILLHNHPSGDPTPSPEDVQVTRQVVEAGQLLDVEVLDHLVIGQRGHATSPQGWISLRERGLGFARPTAPGR